MSEGIIEVKGTKIYFGSKLDASSADPDGIVIHEVSCPTGLTGVSAGEAAKVDVTCMSSATRQYASGLQDLPTLSIPVNLIPQSEAHQALMAAEEAGSANDMPWMLVLSDQVLAPTAINSDGQFVSPGATNRYWTGYVSNFSEDYAVGDYVKATVTVQLTSRIFRTNPVAILP